MDKIPEASFIHVMFNIQIFSSYIKNNKKLHILNINDLLFESWIYYWNYSRNRLNV